MSGFTLAILRQTNMPAILIEYGFMDYEKEAKLMLDKKHQEKCAEAVAKAVCEYFGVTYVAKKSEVKNTDEKPQVASKTKYLRIIADSVNIHSSADFNSSSVVGEVKKGDVYTIAQKIERTGTDMYKLKSGVYITASTKYVEVFEMIINNPNGKSSVKYRLLKSGRNPFSVFSIGAGICLKAMMERILRVSDLAS